MLGRATAAAGGRGGPGAGAVAGSLGLHALLAAAIWITGIRFGPPLPEFKVYRVDIVSLPPQVEGQPDPGTPEPPRVVQPERTVEPKPTPQERRPPPVEKPVEEPKSEPKPASGANPEPDAPVGGDGLNVQLAGDQCPDANYCGHVIRQIYRYFRWTGAPDLSAEVYFVIRRDGSIEDVRVVRGSGNTAFDLEAMGAIEQAGRRNSFGALPDAFRGDRLPVLFEFRPPR